MVLQGPGDDLRCRRRSAVDQHHDGHAVEDVVGRRPVLDVVRFVTAARGHDDAFGEEGVGHRHGTVENAARVVAQVENQAVEIVAGAADQVPELRAHGARGIGLELGDAHVDDVAVDPFAAHAGDLDLGALEGDYQRLARAFANDGQIDGGAGLAAHHPHRLVEAETLYRRVVEPGDYVAALD